MHIFKSRGWQKGVGLEPWCKDTFLYSWDAGGVFGYMKITEIRSSFDTMIAANYDEYSERLSRKTKSIIVPDAAIYQIAWQLKMGIFSLTAEKLFNNSWRSG